MPPEVDPARNQRRPRPTELAVSAALVLLLVALWLILGAIRLRTGHA